MTLIDLAAPVVFDPSTDDQTLVARLTALAREEREARADFVVYLAAFDERRLYLKAGFPSLFAWLTEHLRFAKASAYRRVAAARLYARMPAVAGFLRDGRVSLTKLCLLKERLQPDNCLALLERAAGMTEQEVEELAVLGDTKGRPAPARDSIRPVAPPPSRAAVAQDDLFAAAARAGSATEPTPAEKPGEVRHEIRMNVGKEFMGFLEDVRAQLSNAHPGASLEVVFLECMKAALGVWRRRSRGETGRPRATAKGAKGRNVAAGVRRNVWRRDGGRCTFVSEDGRRCTATHRLQLHHVIPFACGGAASEDNIRLLCSLHNDLMARVDFGDGHMDRFTGRTRAVAG